MWRNLENVLATFSAFINAQQDQDELALFVQGLMFRWADVCAQTSIDEFQKQTTHCNVPYEIPRAGGKFVIRFYIWVPNRWMHCRSIGEGSIRLQWIRWLEAPHCILFEAVLFSPLHGKTILVIVFCLEPYPQNGARGPWPPKTHKFSVVQQTVGMIGTNLVLFSHKIALGPWTPKGPYFCAVGGWTTVVIGHFSWIVVRKLCR